MSAKYLLYSVLSTISILILFYGCNNKVQDNNNDEVVVVVYGENLYKNEIISSLPKNISVEDSLFYVQNYIENWISKKILYNKARNTLKESNEIEKKINAYREQLYIYNFKENFINQNINYNVSDEEIKEYYNEHLHNYILKSIYVKSHCLTMDANVNRYSDEWEKLVKSSILDKKFFKDYCYGTGRKAYFYENWTKLNEFLEIINYSGELSESEIKPNNVLIYTNNKLRYFVKIDSVLYKGDNTPIELVKEDISLIIVNNRKKNIMSKLNKELYQECINSGNLKIMKK